MSDSDFALLQSRAVNHAFVKNKSILHIFATNAMVDAYNQNMLRALEIKIETMNAINKQPSALRLFIASKDSLYTGVIVTGAISNWCTSHVNSKFRCYTQHTWSESRIFWIGKVR